MVIYLQRVYAGKWNAEELYGLEADDAIGIYLSKTKESIACSIDKDLRQIPGLHWNFVKKELYDVSEYIGAFNFYRQLLIGDVSDNIKGVHGIGPVKAEKFLFGLEPEEMFSKVRFLYDDDERMLVNGQCLWLFKKEMDLWNPQEFVDLSIGQENLKLVAALLSDYMRQMDTEMQLSLELTKCVQESGSLALGPSKDIMEM